MKCDGVAGIHLIEPSGLSSPASAVPFPKMWSQRFFQGIAGARWRISTKRMKPSPSQPPKISPNGTDEHIHLRKLPALCVLGALLTHTEHLPRFVRREEEPDSKPSGLWRDSYWLHSWMSGKGDGIWGSA